MNPREAAGCELPTVDGGLLVQYPVSDNSVSFREPWVKARGISTLVKSDTPLNRTCLYLIAESFGGSDSDGVALGQALGLRPARGPMSLKSMPILDTLWRPTESRII